MCQKCPSG